MKQIHRLFLVVEGDTDGYPNYQKNHVHLTESDPSQEAFSNLFICSPLFSLNLNGVSEAPIITDGTNITFLMVPNIYPSFCEILHKFSPGNKIWFSLGLANLIIIEDGNEMTSKVKDYLTEKKNLTASETWNIQNHKISSSQNKLEGGQTSVEHCGIKISSKLPLSIKFSISEHIISIDKFLTASKKFTPYYFEAHKKTIQIANKRLINDLSFIHGDNSFEPSPSLIKTLKKNTTEDAFEALKDPTQKEKIEEIINDRHGRLIQFNSSMSYLYSQGYAGTFPIFDHIGIVRRHSLLGIGTAISALFELVANVEGSLVFLPFDKKEILDYSAELIPETYLEVFTNPSKYNSSIWSEDRMVLKLEEVTNQTSENFEHLEKPKSYYNRFAFYSGRMGFREYDFSATSAIQVLVESHCLEYHVINYTHEIIHNHVRTILNTNLVNIPTSVRNNDYLTYLNQILTFLDDYYHRRIKSPKISYKDYFVLLIINYCINSEYFGSLSKEFNGTLIESKRADYDLPTASQLKEIIKQQYKDINEIFVHIIDFSYIYQRDVRAYILSIWSSWSTVPSVTTDLKQYVIRTLITIGITLTGDIETRFKGAKATFLGMLAELVEHNNAFVFENIRSILQEEIDDDLRYRFNNCIIIADLAYHYFVGEIDTLFENGDGKVLEKTSDSTNNSGEVPDVYDLETGKFTKIEIKSKTRFLLDQLLREIRRPNKKEDTDEYKEKISSWLLLSLSSFNKV